MNREDWIAIWSAVLTLFAGLLGWNWNKMDNKVEGKADKEALDAHVEEVTRRFNELIAERKDDREREDEKHKENRERLDKIYQLLLQRGGGR